MKETNVKLFDFFIVVPLEFEESLLEELQEVQPWILGSDGRPSPHGISVQKIRKGGLEIQAPWCEGLQLVHHLKSPVRILWRWKSKKISHVSELKTWIRGLRPQDFFEGPLGLKIQSRKSRLQNEKMIHRVFCEDWKQIRETADQILYVDVYDDQFTLSWDLCGEPLFKRGWSPKKGEAPLRENFAHLLLRDLIRGRPRVELENLALVDPMMGSGTFLWESLGWNELNTQRKFSYQQWKGLPQFLKTEWWKNSTRPRTSLFGSHFGFDRDSHAVETANSNAQHFSARQLAVKRQDLLSNSVGVPTPCYLVSNPPYGERLEVDSIEKLMTRALEIYQPQRALFLAPRGLKHRISSYTLEPSRSFLQGGLEVCTYQFLRSC